MSNRPPHVPPAGGNGKESAKSGAARSTEEENAANDAKVSGHDTRLQNVKEQGDQANIQQNTSNKRFHR